MGCVLGEGVARSHTISPETLAEANTINEFEALAKQIQPLIMQSEEYSLSSSNLNTILSGTKKVKRLKIE